MSGCVQQTKDPAREVSRDLIGWQSGEGSISSWSLFPILVPARTRLIGISPGFVRVQALSAGRKWLGAVNISRMGDAGQTCLL